MPIKIAISWAAGAWKSSVIRRIVEEFGYSTSDLWQVMRERAVEKGMTIAEYDKIIEKHPEEDVKIDNDFKKIVKWSKKNIIVSWRMGFHCLPEVLSIRLDVSPKEWARRIFLQNRGKQEKAYKNVGEAMKANKDRMKRLKKRLLKVYWVDFTDKKNYTIVIKTDGQSIEETAQVVIKAAKQFQKKTRH